VTITTGKKLLYSDGEKNIFDIYKLEDHTGKEITIEELVDKYLKNPELCFKECWHLPPYYSEGFYRIRANPNPESGPQDNILSNLITSTPPSRPNLLE
jgi:hypothetical protein